MRRTTTLALAMALTVAVGAGCREHGHPHEGDHGHEGGEAHPHEGDHGHGHEADPERPTLAVTRYQDGLELFMEYPAFVAGQESPLVAHFTDARAPDAFKPVNAGQVTATLRYADGKEERFVAEKLLRTGIFKPVVKPSRAGQATLALRLEGEQVSGSVEVGEVTVHPDVAAAIAAAPPEGAGAGAQTVSFLKEQQWKTEYATAPAELRVLQGGVRATGELEPVPGQAAELSAPVAGRLVIGERVPHVGQVVKKGELLVRLAPTAVAGATDVASVELELSRARAELQLARRELQRSEELLAAKAIPEKQVDAARTAVQVAEARAAAAEQQRASFAGMQSGTGAGRTFELRSPIDGVVSFANVTPGAVVEAGARLAAIVNAEQLWLELRVYEVDAPKVENASGAAFEVAGFDSEFVVDASNGRRVAVGAVVDRLTRTVPVIFELKNPGGRLKPGMFARATIFTGEAVRAVAVPESAVIDDGGKPTVFVMEGGESFFKRPVRPGIRSGGYVQILEGVKEGERVVSRGAWEIKLASASGALPEHGHQH